MLLAPRGLRLIIMGFILEFIMELSSVVTLMSFIVLRDSLGLENPFSGLVSELW